MCIRDRTLSVLQFKGCLCGRFMGNFRFRVVSSMLHTIQVLLHFLIGFLKFCGGFSKMHMDNVVVFVLVGVGASWWLVVWRG